MKRILEVKKPQARKKLLVGTNVEAIEISFVKIFGNKENKMKMTCNDIKKYAISLYDSGMMTKETLFESCGFKSDSDVEKIRHIYKGHFKEPVVKNTSTLNIECNNLIAEVQRIIKRYRLDCTPEQFFDSRYWNFTRNYISSNSRKYHAFWDEISCNNVSLKFMERFQDYINWDLVSKSQIDKISDFSFLSKFQDKLNWDTISQQASLTDKIIEKFAVNLDWDMVVTHQKLSPNIIEKYYDNMCWYDLCVFQGLTEKFIDEHKAYLLCENMSTKQIVKKIKDMKYDYCG